MNDRKSRILSISYDPSLLFTRQAMLELAGYDVVSAEGFADAIEHCSGHFDLIILGHSIPQKDKRAIVAELHERGCNAPLLSLLRHGEHKIPEATRAADPQDVEGLLHTVKEMVAEHTTASNGFH
jgi:DNA-binding NtrC family response regulator